MDYTLEWSLARYEAAKCRWHAGNRLVQEQLFCSLDQIRKSLELLQQPASGRSDLPSDPLTMAVAPEQNESELDQDSGERPKAPFAPA
jgi:hypothetical protein